MKITKYLFIVIISIFLLLFVTIKSLNFQPKKTESMAINSVGKTATLQAGQVLKILNWNVQFFAGNQNNHFVFEGGKEPWPSKKQVNITLRKAIRIIRKENPDIITLQEVQRHSVMSSYVDQVEKLRMLLSLKYKNSTCAYYLKSRFNPSDAYWGPTDQLLCTFSKYRIANSKRVALDSKLNIGWLAQQFHPKRAMLIITLPIKNAMPLTVINTHLSAFAMKTDTQAKQTNQIFNYLTQLRKKNKPVIVTGDFNLLASTDLVQDVIGYDRHYYSTKENLLEPFFTAFNAFPSKTQLLGSEKEKFYTYMPVRKLKTADRTLDYVFTTRNVKILSGKVIQTRAKTVSDHYPISATIKLPS